jgi:hypothetical protein
MELCPDRMFRLGLHWQRRWRVVTEHRRNVFGPLIDSLSDIYERQFQASSLSAHRRQYCTPGMTTAPQPASQNAGLRSIIDRIGRSPGCGSTIGGIPDGGEPNAITIVDGIASGAGPEALRRGAEP